MNWDTFNDVYGATRNPWNPEFSPGGSSGGEAAAIASGLSRAGIGSDGGGSIRLPAALCGIVGLKPTPGRIPAAGHFPKIAHPGGLLGVIGPMARTVADTKAVFDVIAHHHASDPFSVPFSPLPFPSSPRLGLLEPFLPADQQEFLPYPLVAFPAFPWQRAYEIWEFFFLRLNAHPLGKPTPHTARFLEAPPPSAEEILNMLTARDALRSRLLSLMEEIPFVLAPVFLGAPWRSGEFPGPPVAAPLTYANLFGLPALSLPIAVENGLPTAWQLIGRPWEEEALLTLAAAVEVRRGPFPRPPLALPSLL
ncbi:MAG: hypothetical protein OHK0021_13230 [Bryobacter sp.]